MMDSLYELPRDPFFRNPATGVSLYHAISLLRNRQPVILKRHDIYMSSNKADFLNYFSQVLNAGLTQARVEHENACKILEFRVDVDLERGCFTVYHVLEALERDLGVEVEERKQAVSEEELRKFLQQTATALAYAHSKDVSHRDVKPGNIFLTRNGDFKVGDFGSSHQQTSTRSAQTVTGTMPYMSPQLRDVVCGYREKYDPYKHDVFGLGMSAMSLVTNTVFLHPWPVQEIPQRVRDAVTGYTQEMKDLLKGMMEVDEPERLSMEVVARGVTGKGIPLELVRENVQIPAEKVTGKTPATRLPRIKNASMSFFDFESNTWGEDIRLSQKIDTDGGIIWVLLEQGVYFAPAELT